MRTTFLQLSVLAVLLASVLAGTPPANAQESVVFSILSESEVWIDGTSNKSDWTVYAERVSGFVRMDPAVPVPEPGVDEAHLVVPAAEMRSRRSTIMDRLMFDALKVEDHPNIVYQLTAVEPAASSPDGDGAFVLAAQGRLSIAGTTNDVTVSVTGEKLDGGRVRFTGSHALDMTDYGVKPPTAMFGALHTGPEVTVQFDLVVAPQASE